RDDSARGFCGRLTRRITRWPRPRPRRSRRGHRATPLSGTQLVGEPVPPLVEGPQRGAAIGALTDDLEQLTEHGKLRAQGTGVAEVRAQRDGAPAHELHVAAYHGLAPGLPCGAQTLGG